MALHVIPLADLREHDLSTACSCDPRTEGLTDPAYAEPVIIHTAFDQREIIEQAQRLLGDTSPSGFPPWGLFQQ